MRKIGRKMKKVKYKIGDIIRIVGDAGYSIIKADQLGLICKIVPGPSYNEYYLVFDGIEPPVGDDWLFFEEEFELAETESQGLIKKWMK